MQIFWRIRVDIAEVNSISKSFYIPGSKGGRIAFLTQLGYALGLLFFVPLGDKLERRGQILWLAAAAVVALILAATAPTLIVLEVASVLIGASSKRLAKPSSSAKSSTVRSVSTRAITSRLRLSSKAIACSRRAR